MVTTDVAVPVGADPDVLLRVGREVAIACPFTHLGHKVEVELEDRGPIAHHMRVTIKAYVYDHRYDTAMQTDLLRRAKREFLALGIVKAWELPKAQ